MDLLDKVRYDVPPEVDEIMTCFMRYGRMARVKTLRKFADSGRDIAAEVCKFFNVGSATKTVLLMYGPFVAKLEEYVRAGLTNQGVSSRLAVLSSSSLGPMIREVKRRINRQIIMSEAPTPKAPVKVGNRVAATPAQPSAAKIREKYTAVEDAQGAMVGRASALILSGMHLRAVAQELNVSQNSMVNSILQEMGKANWEVLKSKSIYARARTWAERPIEMFKQGFGREQVASACGVPTSVLMSRTRRFATAKERRAWPVSALPVADGFAAEGDFPPIDISGPGAVIEIGTGVRAVKVTPGPDMPAVIELEIGATRTRFGPIDLVKLNKFASDEEEPDIDLS